MRDWPLPPSPSYDESGIQAAIARRQLGELDIWVQHQRRGYGSRGRESVEGRNALIEH